MKNLQGSLRELSKKIVLIIFLVLLLFAGIIALTQDLENILPNLDFETEELLDEDYDEYFHEEFVKEFQWFRSNSGGMALELLHSKFVALRGEYALAVSDAYREELPLYLLTYYNDDYQIEVRMLYKKGEQTRTQWIFRDINGRTRLNSVLMDPQEIDEDSLEKDNIKGFIEIFNNKSFLTSEYRFLEDGGINKTDYEFNENTLISSSFSVWEDDEIYKKLYADFYRYNRSASLRAIERHFYTDSEDSEILRLTFPRNLMEASMDGIFSSERLNLYPEYFGNIFIEIGSRMIFDIDDRGRVLRQVLYDDEENIIWTIRNVWLNNRIVSTSKIEGDNTLLAEFQYNSDGDRVLERNLNNGELERVVRSDGKTDIEELYMNNVVVLQAIWEDGKKIQERRMNY